MRVADVAGEARDLARYLAAADACLSLALVAAERGWVRPVVDDGPELAIEAGCRPPAYHRPTAPPHDGLS